MMQNRMFHTMMERKRFFYTLEEQKVRCPRKCASSCVTWSLEKLRADNAERELLVLREKLTLLQNK